MAISIKKIFRKMTGFQENDNLNIQSLSAEAEVDFIKKLLERKFKRTFQKRVKVDGYLGNALDYKLVLDDYCSSGAEYHSIFGYSTKNVLDVNKAFLDAYWNSVKSATRPLSEIEKLDNFDKRMAKKYQETMVAKSREELLLLATLEGVEAGYF
jgi:hypothetical protein